jgi:mono/diheme cytochrome c family protein
MKHLINACGLTLVGVAAMAATPKDLNAGKKLYTGKCARCHRLYDPALYGPKAWETWMTKMRSKAKLSPIQHSQLTAYIESLRLKETK